MKEMTMLAGAILGMISLVGNIIGISMIFRTVYREQKNDGIEKGKMEQKVEQNSNAIEKLFEMNRNLQTNYTEICQSLAINKTNLENVKEKVDKIDDNVETLVKLYYEKAATK
jgi:protoporphyrinogen oxidase